MKGLKLSSFLVVFFFGLVSLVMAVDPDYEITNVEINGVDVSDGTTHEEVYVERGDTLDITVDIYGGTIESVDNVKVMAWIEGYEYDDIEAKTRLDVRVGSTRDADLSLEIPYNIDLDGSYVLYVKAGDSSYSDEIEIPLTVEVARHKLDIQDVIFRSGTSLKAGKTLYATVWVENVGENQEENIDVKLSIPALGVSDRYKIDDLYDEDEEYDKKDTESVNLALIIPKNAESGVYDVIVSVEYNKGHDEETQVYELTVEGKAEVSAGIEAIISIDTTSQTVAPGEGAVYKVMFANLDTESKTYSLEVAGVDTWANSRVDPGFLTVKPGESGEMYVYVSAFESASSGKHMFTVRVKSAENVLKEINLEVGISENAVISENTWDQVRKGLEIGFAVLLVILVILGIILAASKFKRNKGITEEEPSTGEGQTYYYYPRY